MLHCTLRALTTGSTEMSISGSCVKPNHSRLLGGGLMCSSRLPDRLLITTASSSGTLYGLKREPRLIVSTVLIVSRMAPV